MAAFLHAKEPKAKKEDAEPDMLKVTEGVVDRDASWILEVAAGWDLDDEFGKDSVRDLVNRYAGAAGEILRVYVESNAGQKAKN
jgi:hypothetical protein